jgi:translation elongation factor EF-Tu-like GTPase
MDLRPTSTGELQLRVRFRLLTPEEGGRHRGISAGYRASWLLQLEGESPTTVHDAPITAMEPPTIHPGDVALAMIRPAHPEFWSSVASGRSVEMREGPRTVGRGVVVEDGARA